MSSDGYVYKTYIKDKLESDYHISIKINYYDNPFFPSVLNKDRERDYDVMPRDIYLHIWEGETNDYNELSVIDISRIGRYNDLRTNPQYQTIILSIDTATSIKSGADYSVVAVVGLTLTNDYHLIHLARGHYDWHTLLNKILEVYQLTYTITNQNAQAILVEAKSNGYNVIQELERTTSLNVIPITPLTDKLSRVVNSFLPFIDNFKIPLDSSNPFNFWISDYLAELKAFRADGKHKNDDMIDATSQALNYLANNTIDFARITKTLAKYKQDNITTRNANYEW